MLNDAERGRRIVAQSRSVAALAATTITLYIFSLVVISSSLLEIFFSTPNSTPSVAKMPMQIPAWPMASMAYSTW